MQSEVLALGIQVAIFVVTSILGYRILMREKREILAHVETFVDSRIQAGIDDVGEALGQIFEKPIVKASMTNIGKLGGAAMQNKALINRMATDVLDGPKFAGLKMAAKMGLNIDIDEYIEENGAVATLQAAQSLGALIGIDVTKIMNDGLNGANLAVGPEANGTNYYLRS